MKKAIFLMLAALGGTGAAQTWEHGGVRHTLAGCERIAFNVECRLTVVSPGTDRSVNFLPSSPYVLISPTGREARIAQAFLNETRVDFTTLRADIVYPLRLVFSNYSENTVRYFDIGRERREHIPIRTTVAVPPSATAVPASPPASAPASALPTTTALPGQAEWRQRVRVNNVNHVAVVHGCFRTGAANSVTASCLVSLLPENPLGVVGGGGASVMYNSHLIQFNGQRITNNTVNLQVGDSLIRAIPVR